MVPEFENEENDPDKLAEDAVVWRVRVPVVLAVVPEAVFEKEKDADPPPPVGGGPPGLTLCPPATA